MYSGYGKALGTEWWLVLLKEGSIISQEQHPSLKEDCLEMIRLTSSIAKPHTKMSRPENLADKIARLLETEAQSPDMARLFASIERLNHRLEKVEASLNPQALARTSQLDHPSLDKLSVAEAIADEIFAGIQKEKACAFEPNGKPCDHCSMCNSRGF